MAESLFVRVYVVCQMLTVSHIEAYRIIKRLNAELCGIRTDRKASLTFKLNLLQAWVRGIAVRLRLRT